MPCKSWSLEAIKTCAGAINRLTGELVDACKGCYAASGFYLMKPAVALRQHNKQDWQRDDWCNDMVEALARQNLFRWFDSGDCYHPKLALKILEVMIRTPHVRHWFPTRQYKFEKFIHTLELMNALPNVVVRYSSDSIRGGLIEGEFISTIIPTDNGDYSVCRAYSRGGKCGDCRMCWDRDIPIIQYPQHGRTMAKVNRQLDLQIAA